MPAKDCVQAGCGQGHTYRCFDRFMNALQAQALLQTNNVSTPV